MPFLNNNRVLIVLAVLIIGGVVGFFVWQSLFCSGCLASDQEMDEKQPEVQTMEKQESNAPQVGSLAPDFSLENLEGTVVSLSDFVGQNVLLVFWASACGWCEKERPDLIRFTKEHKGSIEVLAVSSEHKEQLRRYKEENQINFTLLSDPTMKTQASYLSFGTPAHFSINKQGKVTATRPGYASYVDLMMLAASLEEK